MILCVNAYCNGNSEFVDDSSDTSDKSMDADCSDIIDEVDNPGMIFNAHYASNLS